MNQIIAKHKINITAAGVFRDGQQLFDLSEIYSSQVLAHLYRNLGISYPKFFKMDRISKLGFIATEILMQVIGEGINKDKVALLLTTADGSREIDGKFEASISDIPSPALFVYTLPNIVAGEICIRNGFKGEQMVWMAEKEDKILKNAYLSSLFSKGNTDACLTGFLNVYKEEIVCELEWIERI